ncbi:glycosyltransferase family 61 protein [Azospirillum rugosum]|uniref:Capsular polysaccharide biosynthesis protein n=1 Tax=Azospirillum rugosum TaxID=416170 RepID=A0ABS4SSN7_9PROT|nr:glycosyltransferase 61 family protein [Azospirillum rugosum]MBP2294400.1 capsular polysaccharide biosynthesis protein [Azospirillum rugosum]MDQ0527735.1 capsular polysaccharide biosynthesis protein [Azospirillum rugosum]
MRPTPISPPDDSAILTLTSPAFDAAYPRVVNKELIPQPILQSMEWAWNTPRFPERPVRVLRLADVWVAKEGLVFDREGNLYRETITQHSEAEVDQAHAAVLEVIGRGEEADAGGPVLLCKKRGIGNYGHWMMEMLPKAQLVHRHLPDLDARFLVAHAPGHLNDSMAQSLSMLGIDLARTIVADDTPRRFADLLVVDGLSEHGGYMSPLVLDSVDALVACVPAAGAERLFVTRRTAGFRRVVGEDALIAQAQAHGYTLVDPGTLTLPQQVSLFKGATRIVGVMGAAMTNIAFAAPGARVVTLTPAGMPDTFFWFIATLRGLDYTEVRCPQSGPVRGVMPWDTDLVLSAQDQDRIFAD